VNIAARCTSCNTATRLPVPYLLIAAVPPAAENEAVGTVAWICQSCADLSIHSIDRSALLALLAGGAELVDGRRAGLRSAPERLPDHPSPEGSKESTP